MWEIWAKLIVANSFKKLPKVQKIAQSGHTACDPMPFVCPNFGTINTYPISLPH